MKDKLVILTGPTAVGKTSISIDLAKKLNGEIISADSMQIYKYMDIGTAKIKEEEMEGIPHHLVDIIDPNESFTVSDYKNRASSLIKDINARNKLPIVVGGTGLYINSLVYNLKFSTVPPNESIREQLECHDNEYLHNELVKIDKESGTRISINDRKRIIRALEIFKVTGKTIGEYNFREENEEYDLAMVCLNMDREKLYERINHRVDIMIGEGLVEEVKNILHMGYDKSLVALQGIGYKEIIMYLDKTISLEEAINLIKQYSRNYAKRQLTWFRRDNRIRWVDGDEFTNFDSLSTDIYDYIKGSLNT